MGEASTDTVKSVFEQESSGEGIGDPLKGEGPILVITSIEIKGAFLLTDCSEYKKYYISKSQLDRAALRLAQLLALWGPLLLS